MRSKYPANDLRQRLEGSVIRYKDKPVFVMVDGTNLLLYAMSDTRRRNIPEVVSGNDLYLDVSTVPMGYVNIGGYVVYSSRIPVRRYKQGVDESNVATVGVDGGAPQVRLHIHSPEFERTILGAYPSLDKVIAGLRDGSYVSQAINRDIALNIDALGIVRVYYKTETVGWIAPGKKKVNVPSSNVGWIISKNLEGFDWEIE